MTKRQCETIYLYCQFENDFTDFNSENVLEIIYVINRWCFCYSADSQHSPVSQIEIILQLDCKKDIRQ